MRPPESPTCAWSRLPSRPGGRGGEPRCRYRSSEPGGSTQASLLSRDGAVNGLRESRGNFGRTRDARDGPLHNAAARPRGSGRVGSHHEGGGDGGHALAAAGEPQPVGGGRRHRHRRADRGREHRLGLGAAGPEPGPVADHLDRHVADLEAGRRAPGGRSPRATPCRTRPPTPGPTYRSCCRGRRGRPPRAARRTRRGPRRRRRSGPRDPAARPARPARRGGGVRRRRGGARRCRCRHVGRVGSVSRDDHA